MQGDAVPSVGNKELRGDIPRRLVENPNNQSYNTLSISQYMDSQHPCGTLTLGRCSEPKRSKVCQSFNLRHRYECIHCICPRRWWRGWSEVHSTVAIGELREDCHHIWTVLYQTQLQVSYSKTRCSIQSIHPTLNLDKSRLTRPMNG